MSLDEKISKYDEEEKRWLKEVYQGDKMPEATWKAFLVGTVLAALMVIFNIYMGLKTGWGTGGSIMAAILGLSMVKLFNGTFSTLENNMSQTMASAGASIGNIVNVIPAIFLLLSSGHIVGEGPTWLDIFLWIFCVSFLGVFFAIPLRKQIIVIEKLKFPSGTACAETIKVMHSAGKEAFKKASVLSGMGVISGLVTWFRDGWPSIIPQASYFMGVIKGCSLKSLTLGVSFSPMMFGAGFLIGPRVGISMFCGAIITFLIMAPYLFTSGILQEVCIMMGEDRILTAPSYPYIVKWSMWPGMALMVSYGLMATIMKWKIVVKAFKSMWGVKYERDVSHLELPFVIWLIGLLLTSCGIISMLYLRFDVPLWVGILAIPISFIFSTIAVRATGETDINPVGSMGAITQIIYGVLNPTAITTLLTGGVSAAGAGQSADMMQDLKTGYLLGATPKKQAYMQLLGVIVGALVAVPVFLILVKAYGIGSAKLPAPAAITWSGLAQMMSRGFKALPTNATTALVIATIAGSMVAILEEIKPKSKKYLLSPVGIGVAMVVPAIYSFTMFLGSLVYLLIKIKNKKIMDDYAPSIGAGGIAGEGIIGVLAAILVVFKIL